MDFSYQKLSQTSECTSTYIDNKDRFINKRCRHIRNYDTVSRKQSTWETTDNEYIQALKHTQKFR